MKFSVIVKPGRKNQSLLWDGSMIVASISARAQEGQANKQLIKVLADFFDLPKTRVRLVAGHTASHKRVEIDLDNEQFLKYIRTITPPTNSQLF